MAIFEDGKLKPDWLEGTVYHDISASSVVDGAVNFIFTYITYDGRSVTSSNFGDVEVQLDIEPQQCGVCIYDFDGNGLQRGRCSAALIARW